MKKAIMGLLAVLSLVIAGCDKSTATDRAGKGFALEDVSNQTIKQTESNIVKVSIDRKGGYDGDVMIDVSGLPAGVTVDGGNSQKILAKDTSINLKLMASDAAAPTEKNEVRVKASATVDGTPLAKEDNFNLTVKSK